MKNKSNVIKLSLCILILISFIYFIYYAFAPFFIYCSSKDTSIDFLINNVYLCDSDKRGILIESDSKMRLFDYEGKAPDIFINKETFYTFNYLDGIFITSESKYFVYGSDFLYEENTKVLYKKFN